VISRALRLMRFVARTVMTSLSARHDLCHVALRYVVCNKFYENRLIFIEDMTKHLAYIYSYAVVVEFFAFTDYLVRNLAMKFISDFRLSTCIIRPSALDNDIAVTFRFTGVFSERELKFMFAICHRPSVCRLSSVCRL